jgi:hypothetical protein
MEFLFSNLPPLRTKNNTFGKAFYDLLNHSVGIDIAVGYVTADSLMELKKAVELCNTQSANLTIGMHYIEKFTELEYRAALDLHSFLKDNHLGSVKLVTPFKYHGKLYSYKNDTGVYAGIIGSNNLSSIIENNRRVYESSLLIDDRDYALQMNQFIQKLNLTAATDIDQLEITDADFKKNNPLLENHEYVRHVEDAEMFSFGKEITDITFDIPITTYEDAPGSNINAFQGKGRINKKTGIIKPRHWYEAELIVPVSITRNSDYPKAETDEATFTVITDDGWKFDCNVSGTNSKNFRSASDNKILGKWLKGRLEAKGVLRVGEPVTKETLEKYGRHTFTLTKTKIPNMWYLSFEVKK